jgi:hypothetical protein
MLGADRLTLFQMNVVVNLLERMGRVLLACLLHVPAPKAVSHQVLAISRSPPALLSLTERTGGIQTAES